MPQVNPLTEVEKILAGRYADGSAGKGADDPPDEYHIKWKARQHSPPISFTRRKTMTGAAR